MLTKEDFNNRDEVIYPPIYPTLKDFLEEYHIFIEPLDLKFEGFKPCIENPDKYIGRISVPVPRFYTIPKR